ncbi:MAG: hypothetical protein K8L97_27235 [Anaerolineae bacterium]|nr:hypothetical protein [Anaerolineae bacterium]
MKATLTVSTNGNLSTIIIRRQMALKTIPVATANVPQALKSIAIWLSNAGYEVVEG